MDVIPSSDMSRPFTIDSYASARYSLRARVFLTALLLSSIDFCNGFPSSTEDPKPPPGFIAMAVIVGLIFFLAFAATIIYYYMAYRAIKALLRRSEGTEGGGGVQQGPMFDFRRFRFVVPPANMNASDSTLHPLNPQHPGHFEATNYNPSAMKTNLPYPNHQYPH
ncbi:hypothetical protein BKA70DRAFT_1300581 [Coprinopsis sp. MPI-PUGE-AT-0042]|nr:hypothetical protein BKA70DRAFT_1300581 [Coprinopsis sp. MPI-PUGE-AT-0042]